MRVLAIWAAIGLLGAAMGCARYQYVNVRSHPEGAEIYLDGEQVGTTPLRLRVHRDDHHKVFLKKPGYRSELVILELQPAPDGIDFLTPPDVDVQLSPGRDASPPDGELGRELEIEVDRE